MPDDKPLDPTAGETARRTAHGEAPPPSYDPTAGSTARALHDHPDSVRPTLDPTDPRYSARAATTAEERRAEREPGSPEHTA